VGVDGEQTSGFLRMWPMTLGWCTAFGVALAVDVAAWAASGGATSTVEAIAAAKIAAATRFAVRILLRVTEEVECVAGSG